MVIGRAANTYVTIALCANLLGCATNATLTVRTEPPGGYITEMYSGKVFGLAPVEIKYDANGVRAAKDALGCASVKGLEARWVSGASSSINPVRLCGENNGSYAIKIVRDPSSEGLEKDLRFAIQLQNADTARLAAAIALIQAMPKSQPYVNTFTPMQSSPATPSVPPTSLQATQKPGMAFLRSQYISGQNRICTYDRLGSQEVITVGAFEFCPPNRQ